MEGGLAASTSYKFVRDVSYVLLIAMAYLCGFLACRGRLRDISCSASAVHVVSVWVSRNALAVWVSQLRGQLRA